MVFLLTLGATLGRNGHVRVDVLQGGWGPRRRARVELGGTLLLLLPFALVVLLVSLEPAWASWRIGELSPDPGGLPRFWVKTLIPLGFLLLALQGVAEAIRLADSLRSAGSGSPPPDAGREV